jgi:hypothetical protein
MGVTVIDAAILVGFGLALAALVLHGLMTERGGDFWRTWPASSSTERYVGRHRLTPTDRGTLDDLLSQQ